MTDTKVCTKCGAKYIAARGARCEACHRAYMVEYRRLNPEKVRVANRNWAKSNPEKSKAQRRRHYLKHKVKILERTGKRAKEKRSECRETARRWRAKNPEKVRAYSRKWRETNSNVARENVRKWAARNLEWGRLKTQRRRAAKLNTGLNQVRAEDLVEIFELWHYNCAYCLLPQELLPATLTVDHVIPLSRGGAHSVENIVPACGYCNSSKGSKLVSEWLKTSQ